MQKLTGFPEFLTSSHNLVCVGDRAGNISGYLYEAADGGQAVFWDCPEGGTMEVHTHEGDEYFIVLQGQYSGVIDGREIMLGPGDELLIPAGTPHNGTMSAGFRAIDVWAKPRF